MAIQKTVLKVHLSCAKCKKKLMKAVSEIEGVDKIEVDSGKETLTVIGNADPYTVILKARKAGKYAEVVSIGPPPKPNDNNKPGEKPKPKTPDHPIVIPHVHAHWCSCPMCYYYYNVGMFPVCYENPNPTCSIM